MVDFASLGQGLGGLGGFASGISSAFGLGKKKKGPTPGETIRNQIKGVRQASEQYGIHPLAILGGSVGGSSAFNVRQAGVGDGLGQALQGLGDAASAIGGRDLQKRQIALSEQDTASRVALQDAQAAYWKQKALSEATSRTQIAGVRNNPTNNHPGVRVFTDNHGGRWIASNSTDAQEAEDRYGGIIGEFQGLSNYFSDWWNQPSRPRYRPRRRVPGGRGKPKGFRPR